jgi:hypothetical protein
VRKVGEYRVHRVTITIQFQADLVDALSALTRLGHVKQFLDEVRQLDQVSVECQVQISPTGLLLPEIAAAVAALQAR